MKNRFQNLAIRNSIIAVFILFSLALVTNYLLTSYFFNDIEEGQYLVNIAGKNRTLSQRILIESQQIAKGDENLKVTLNNTILEHNTIMNALENGGEVTMDGQKVFISHKAKGKVLEVINEAKKYWKRAYEGPALNIVTAHLYIVPHEESIQGEQDEYAKRVINPSILRSLEDLEHNATYMLILNERVVESYLELLDDRRRAADRVIMWLTIAVIIFLVLGYFFIYRLILKPLRSISYVASDISEGNLNQQINYNVNNEVGAVTQAINGMVKNLQNATTFVRDIGEGNLDVQYEGISEEEATKATLAAELLGMRDRMKLVAKEESERKWATEGLALFVDILRENNTDIKKLSYEIISNIVKYIDALQGGLYVINDDNPDTIFAELFACYAFGKQKFLKQKIYEGEGVIGQVLREGEKIYITDVPDDFPDISSGMGQAQPKSILIIPLKLNDQQLGMIELASFHNIYPYQIEFLERLANNIASTLANARVNEKTKTNLTKQQQLTDNLKKKEEDLRHQMNDLKDSQSIMEKRQKQLAAQSFAIKSSALVAEYDLQGKLIRANKQFLKNFKYDIKEVRGKQHRIFLDTDTAQSAKYIDFWKDLESGKIQTGEYSHVTNGGEKLWLRAAYVPILDFDGNPYQVFALAFNINHEKQIMLDYQSKYDAINRSNVIIEFDLKANIKSINEELSLISQYKEEDLVGKHFNALMGKLLAEDDLYKGLWRKLNNGIYEKGEYEFATKDGDSYWLYGVFNPVLDLKDIVTKIVFTGYNVTHLKEERTEIVSNLVEYKQQQDHLIALINNTDELIFSINRDFVVTSLNIVASSVFKSNGRDVERGTNLIHTFPTPQYETLKRPYDKALKGEKIIQEEKYNTQGELVQLLTTYNPIFDDNDNIQGVSVFAKDITQLKQNEEKLIKIQRDMTKMEKELKSLVNISDDITYSIDLHFQVIVFNEVFRKEVFKRRQIKVKNNMNMIYEVHDPANEQFWKEIYTRGLNNETVILPADDPNNMEKKEIKIVPVHNEQDRVIAISVRIKMPL